ncbi:MAG: endolytic transglycosylase MltG [Deltaproteobacteria bacterium]|nr:endolytic transglycosylase MltG [Deltaproteobacteria bacterium]
MRGLLLTVVSLILAVAVAVSVGWHLLYARLATPLAPLATVASQAASGERQSLTHVMIGRPEATQPTPKAVMDALAAAKLVETSPLIDWYAQHMFHGERLVPGEYALSPSMSLVEQLAKIERGDIVLRSVSIQPGATREDVVGALVAQGLCDADALVALIRDASFASSLGLKAPSLDGFLYPDVYTLPRGLAPRRLLSTLVARFKTEIPDETFRDAARLGYEPVLVVAVASVLERADLPAAELRLFARVVYNRLAVGLPLGRGVNAFSGLPASIDEHAVTVERRTRRVGKKARRRRRAPALSSPSASPSSSPSSSSSLPLSSRLLPIGNPGRRAVVAAANPATTDAIYFVARDDGTHVFCADRECFEAARRRWGALPGAVESRP